MAYPEHEPYHERSVDAQILDALLRIEELMRNLAIHLKAKTVEVSIPADDAKLKSKRK